MTTWERRSEWPLVGAAALFLAAYAWPILQPGLSKPAHLTCDLVTWATWVLFVIDYLIRLFQSQDRGRFFARHLLDLAVVALPLLRPLRLLRLVMLLRVLNREATVSLRGRVAIYVAGGAALLAFVAALAVLDAERHSTHANITDFPTAAWWAVSTMTTVGYGDHYPVTAAGRLAAVGLMIGGIALLGAVTATLASWLVDKVAEEATSTDELRVEIAGLRDEIRQLVAKGAGQQGAGQRPESS
jgi:voltage-gated potassium channel